MWYREYYEIIQNILIEYVVLDEDIRYPPKYTELYKERKEKRDRIFAELKKSRYVIHNPKLRNHFS